MAAAGIGWVDGITHEWSEEQNLDAMKFLLDHGANVNVVNQDGRGALHWRRPQGAQLGGHDARRARRQAGREGQGESRHGTTLATGRDRMDAARLRERRRPGWACGRQSVTRKRRS